MGVMDLVRHLRTWGPAQLARLLETRPDLLPASDRGLDALARKAGTATSLGRALVTADVGMLVVAEALVAIHPATIDEVDDLLGTADPLGVLDAIERLHDRGVVMIDDGVVHPVGALADLLHRPLGLGPSFVELADQLSPDCLRSLAADTLAEGGQRSTTIRAVARRLREPATVERLLDGAPTGTTDLLDHLTTSRSPAISLPTAFTYRDPSPTDPLGWLLMRGLVVPVSERGAELPRELVIATHPAGLAPGAVLRPIEPELVPGLGAEVVSGQAADRANRTLDGMENLLRLAARGEISVRRAGGVGPRELSRLGRVTGLERDEVTRLLELASAARLIAIEGIRLDATELADRWWSLERRRRYLALVRAWSGSDHFLSRGLAGDQTGDDRAAGPTALGTSEPVAAASAARALALDALASVEPGAAWDPDQLAASVVWQAPNLWGPGHPGHQPPPEDLMAWTVAEAELLGLAAGGAPSPVLRALRSGDEAALDVAVAAAVADDQETLVLQPDLTALALGPLAPSVARPLADMTDRTADGDDRAPGFRFTEASVRRAYDAGWTAETITAFLAGHALAGIPQPLQYLLDDVARRHGSVRILAASSVVVTDDDVGAVEIASNRRLAALGLRLVAPTVLTSTADPITALEALRGAGFLPVLGDDAIRVDRDRGCGPGHGGGSAPAPVDTPADWTGPSLPAGPFPDEVADAVAALLSEDPGSPTVAATGSAADTDRGSQPSLTSLWGRPVRLRAGGQPTGARPRELTGIIVGLGPAVSILTAAGVIEVPTDSVSAVDRLDRI